MYPNTQILDTTPRGLAEGLDTLVQALREQDRDVAHILATARDSLRTLGWNRYARRLSRQSARHSFTARHKTLKGAAR